MLGEAVAGLIKVLSVAVLLLLSLSVSLAVAEAVLVSSPVAFGVTVMVTIADDPTPNELSEQFTGPLPLQIP
jgi:hypothetical protein